MANNNMTDSGIRNEFVSTIPKRVESAVDSTSTMSMRSPNRSLRLGSSKSEDSQDQSRIIERIRRSFAGCMSPDGQSVVEWQKNEMPIDPPTQESVQTEAAQNAPEVRVLSPDGLKPAIKDMIRKSVEIENEFIPTSLQFEIVGNPLPLAVPQTEEEQNVFEAGLVEVKHENVNLVQANVAEALGGRAWELVAEEKVCSGTKDDIMPEKTSLPPRMIPCRLVKLDIDTERQKLGQQCQEKLKKVEEKRQKLLEKKREEIKRLLEREQVAKTLASHQEERVNKMIDLELKHLRAAINREDVLKERRARLKEAIEKNKVAANEKIVDAFIAESDSDKQQTGNGVAGLEGKEPVQTDDIRKQPEETDKDEEQGKLLQQRRTDMFLGTIELESLMTEYQIGTVEQDGVTSCSLD